MIQVIGIRVGSDFFLAHKEPDLVKAQHKLAKISAQKINISFWFINDLLSLNYDRTFQKHSKDFYPTKLDLKKENNNNSYSSFLDIYIYIENEEFLIKLFDKRDKFDLDIIKMPFYCSNVPSKMFYGSIGAEFPRISTANSKTEDASCSCKQLLSQILKQNGQIRRIKF